MDISSLFQQLHGILDVEALVPLANRRDLVKKKQYDELVKKEQTLRNEINSAIKELKG